MHRRFLTGIQRIVPRTARALQHTALVGAFSLFWTALGTQAALATATTAGTVISNTATATFSDVNSNSFNTTSNTITATVQNAPALTVTAPSNQNITPAEKVVDTFTLTNTGNNSGTFALSADATFGGTASSTTLLGYVIAGTSCTTSSPCGTYSAANTAIAGLSATATGSTLSVGVEYQVSASATSTQTVQTTLSANIAYASLTGAQAETSANSSANPTDTLHVDARLDVQAAASTPGSGGANITWTITANNGGEYAAADLQAAKAVLGAGANGIALFIPVPTFAGSSLALASSPSAPSLSGAASGAAASVYYNATACSSSPTSGWSTTYSSSAKCLAIFLSGGTGGVELPSATSGSSGAGSVSSAQITFSFATVQPSGSGSADTNSVTLRVSSAIGGNAWVTGATPILGQGLAVGASQDANTASLIANIEANSTSSSGTTPPGGASNLIGSQAYASFIVGNGPFNNPDATGSYPAASNSGAAAATSSLDFTALGIPCSSNSASSVNGQSCTVAANTIIVNSLKNEGNSQDTIKLTATAPSGWTVRLYNATGCADFIGTSCTQGSAITSTSSAGGSVNGTVVVPSGTSVYYEAVYNATSNSATPFTGVDASITAAGQSGNGTGSDTNDTHNDLYPGGVVKLTNSVSVTSTNCPAGISPSNSGVCPGGTLQYSIAYLNVAPAAVISNLGTEPAFAYNALYTNTGSLVITDDGQANPSGASAANNWVTYTNGIQAAASDTTSSTVFTYYTAGGSTTSSFPGPAKVTAQVGGSSYQLVPGASGTISFTAVVK